MRDFVAIIDRVLERLEKKEINFDDYVACYLLSNFRQLIESKKVEAEYPIINFYACWALHSALDRNNVSKETLAFVLRGLSACKSQHELTNLINESLQASKLRKEIIKLSKEFEFRNFLSNSNDWLGFYGAVSNLVTNKFLCPPTGSLLKDGEGNTIRIWISGERGKQAQWHYQIIPENVDYKAYDISIPETFSGLVYVELEVPLRKNNFFKKAISYLWPSIFN